MNTFNFTHPASLPLAQSVLLSLNLGSKEAQDSSHKSNVSVFLCLISPNITALWYIYCHTWQKFLLFWKILTCISLHMSFKWQNILWEMHVQKICHCINTIEYNYRNLDGIVYCKPKLYGTVYWDHCPICSLSSTKVSLSDTCLYMPHFVYSFIHW